MNENNPNKNEEIVPEEKQEKGSASPDDQKTESSKETGQKHNGEKKDEVKKAEVKPLEEGEKDRPVPPSNFIKTLAANVNNENMDDEGFRTFVKNSLEVVEGGEIPAQEGGEAKN